MKSTVLGSKKQHSRYLLLGLFAFVIICQFFGISCSPKKDTPKVYVPTSQCLRIVSFAPSITETMFALGLGERVVGVTRYCTYPETAKKLPKVGGYLDPNFEQILMLKPDLVVLLKEHVQLMKFLGQNKIQFISINNEKCAGILQSFETIGRLCGHSAQADSLISITQSELNRPVVLQKRPSILLCIGRDNPGTGSIGQVFVAGPKSFYSELIDAAGGTNAYTDSTGSYPALTAEGIIQCKPDIIIDVMGSMGSGSSVAPEKIVADWNRLQLVPAVKNKQVVCLTGDYLTIPGPRIALVLRDFKTVIEHYGQSR